MHTVDTQKFPSKWKIPKVTPILKGQSSRDEKTNYRPISILPILSKLLEKHICEHLYDSCQKRGLLHRLQSGFRKFYSNEIDLIRLIDQLPFDLDRNKVSGLIFVDYRKAFDLIDHLLLMKKLDAYGIRGNELNLLRDYLSNRSQYVNVDGYCSSLKPMKFGVPQGSNLGLILFLLFINDLPSVVNHSVVDIYADDTTLSYSSEVDVAPTSISVVLQDDLDDISNWSVNNKIIINAKKTKSLLITGKRLGDKLAAQTLTLRTDNEII